MKFDVRHEKSVVMELDCVRFYRSGNGIEREWNKLLIDICTNCNYFFSLSNLFFDISQKV